jgi:hypothetical protein
VSDNETLQAQLAAAQTIIIEERLKRLEALQLLREAFRQRADTNGRCEGWEMVSEAVQILEGT